MSFFPAREELTANALDGFEGHFDAGKRVEKEGREGKRT